MKKITLMLVAIVAFTMTVNGQWKLQTNPLGTGDAAMLGKIQFISPTEGWINASRQGVLLHSIDKGTTWLPVTLFPGEVSGSFSDPALNMSWTDASHGWVLKTSGGNCTTSFNEVNSNGGLLYNTTNGGTSWNRYAFPITVPLTTYSVSDLTGTWQLNMLTTNDNNTSSQSSWQYGTITFDALGAGTETVTSSDGSTNTTPIPALSISSCGTITIAGSTDVHGFISNDKKSAILTMDANSGRSIMIMQKVNSGVTYALADLAGTWQLHSVTAAYTTGTNKYASWSHGTFTINASGASTSTITSSGGNVSSHNVTFAITSSGIVTVNGVPLHGFMSADKQTMNFVVTDDGGYSLYTLQKTNPSTTYTSADLNGKWQAHSIITSPGFTMGSWARATFTSGVMGMGFSDLVVNGTSQDGDDLQLFISPTGEINASEFTHGFMSADKQTIYLTKNITQNFTTGYQLIVLQRDKTTSGDMGLQVQFADANNGWATIFNVFTGNGQLYRTTNGGTNWIPTPNPMLGFYHFIDPMNGWMVGTTTSVDQINTIFRTTDGGQTWNSQFTATTHNGNNVSFNAIHFSDALHGWAVGRDGNIVNTNNGGISWNWVTIPNMPSQSNSKAVYFLNATTGWISVGEEDNEGVGTQFVYATKDGGANWIQQSTPATNSIFSLSFVDANHGWFTSDNGQIAGFSQNSINITAGGLSAALTSGEKNTITGLAITGTMDARDFKTLRDEMPLLEYVDLSGVSIVSYTGTEGTAISGSVTYPANAIPQRAFYNSNTQTGKATLTGIVFPAGITSIGTYGFRACGLRSVTIPSTVTAIGYGNFWGNSNLTSLSIPSSVTIIDKWAFAYCNNLQHIEIPASVTSIGYSAFFKTGLTSITIPEGVTTIDQYAFQSCDLLNNVSLPKSLNFIGYCAFTFNNSLHQFNIANDNAKFSVNNGVLYNKDQSQIVAYPAGSAPMFNIPNSVSVIDTAAFEGNTNIFGVIIPSTVTKLSQEAFYWCTNLQTITIPASVQTIEGYAFYNCTNLWSIHANSSTPVDLSASDSVFKYVDKTNCTLYVPVGSSAAYRAADQWKDFVNIIEETPLITYRVTVPVGTKACYLAGEMNTWSFMPMNKVDATHYEVTTSSLTSYKYKYCSGPDWVYVEKDGSGNDISNRTYTPSDVVASWRHIYDSAHPTPTLTYSVTVPSGTNACYIIGEMNSWTFTAMNKVDATHYTISCPAFSDFEYKYCSGADWSYVEVNADGSALANNRTYTANDVVAKWSSVYLATGIATLDADKFRIYPNPVSEYFYIESEYTTKSISIYNLSGLLMLSQTATGKDYINISSLQPGTYIVRINTENGIAEKKLVKQ